MNRDRYPLMEHMHWARFESGAGKYLLSSSQIVAPPPEVFDTSGVMPLVASNDLREALIHRISERYHVERDEITLTAGVSEATTTAAMGLVEPGDFVLAERPGYQALYAVPHALGAEMHELRRDREGRLDGALAAQRIDEVSALARAGGRRLTAVFTSDLHNPTGARLDADDLGLVVETCDRAGATLVIDEVYRDCDASREIGTARNLYPQVVTLDSLTKAYGMGGLRMGWILATPGKTREFTHVQDFLSVSPSAPSLHLGERALGQADAILSWARAWADGNRATFARVIADRPGGFDWNAEGKTGNIVFPTRSNEFDTRAAMKSWLASEEVEVIPGDFFGAPYGVRIGVAMDPKEFEPALQAWVRAVQRDGDPSETRSSEMERETSLRGDGRT